MLSIKKSWMENVLIEFLFRKTVISKDDRYEVANDIIKAIALMNIKAERDLLSGEIK